MAIHPYLLVDDVMTHWPSTIRVFLDFKFSCVGCPIACFHTVRDAAANMASIAMLSCRRWSFVLTRFLHANRYPLRSKTLGSTEMC